MAERREYNCTNCGRILFRARGTGGDVDVEILCPERRCRRMNTVRPGEPQNVSERMRRKWEQVRREWVTRASASVPVAIPA